MWDGNELWFSASRQVWGVSLVPTCCFCISPVCKDIIGQLFGVSRLDSWRSQSHGHVLLSTGVCAACTFFFKDKALVFAPI